MLPTRLSELIAAGYRQPVPAGVDLESALLARARLLQSLPQARRTRCRRDALLLELIAHYRRGQRQLWAPVLLEVMAPALCQRLQGYLPLRPAMDLDDIAQQLVVELLNAALAIPLPADGQWTERRLLNRATKRIGRWLAREARRQKHQLPPLSDSGEEEVREPWD